MRIDVRTILLAILPIVVFSLPVWSDPFFPEVGEVRIYGGPSGYVEPSKGQVATIAIRHRYGFHVLVTIYGRHGKIAELRKKLEQASFGTVSETTLVWDCRDRAGQFVPSGVYMAHVSGGGITERVKFAVLRR